MTFDDALYATLLQHVPFIPLLCIPLRDEGKVTRCSSPSYEIIDSDEQYQILIDLPFVKGKLNAKVEHDRRILHIVEEVLDDRTDAVSSPAGIKRFEMRFLLGCYVNANHVTLEFEDAVLTVTAGKIVAGSNEESTTINLPVLEHHHNAPEYAKDVMLEKESYNERFEEAL